MNIYSTLEEINTAVGGKLGNCQSNGINISDKDLGSLINIFIADVAKINFVSQQLLTVYQVNDKDGPKNVCEAIETGTKFFDAVYFFAKKGDSVITLKPSIKDKESPALRMESAKKNLLWCYLYIMMRGMYPTSDKSVLGTDVPNFLKTILSMDCSPKEVATALASFDLKCIDMRWVKHVRVSGMAPSIRQRLALGMPGYRLIQPFKLYPCRDDASEEAKEAYGFVRAIAKAPLDWGIMSVTRDAKITSVTGPLNANLSNLMLECFTKEQLDEMVHQDCKILFKLPVKDVRAQHWRTWKSDDPLVLSDPINLN